MTGQKPQLGTQFSSRTYEAQQGDPTAMRLHISKLRGIDLSTRNRLKQRGINYTDQLLGAAGKLTARQDLATDSGIPYERLARLVRRADLTRIKGIGAIFADMLEFVGIEVASDVAAQNAGDLHARLAALNAAERFARRAPTPEEVEDWVMQARNLPHLIEKDELDGVA